MASTSASSVQKSFKYDVFLSFRGEDTRNTFVGHLYKALEQHGIQTYKDDENIEKGEMIDNQLIESIQDSRFFIIVFSKDYAGSSWCLDELVKIMECRKASEQTAYPVFYDVDPTEIRKQSGAVGEAFKKHESKQGAGKWRKALNEAGNLAGWESKTTANGDESKLIQIIVDDIFKKICSCSPSVDRMLVGMETRIEDFLSSLELDAHDVRMIGIWGMGGGGKTTLARAVFDRISIHFDGKSFVENVRSESSVKGLKKLQEQILCNVLSKENITVSSVHEGTNMMKRMIRGRKVLIVLDDVDDMEQLEALAGEPDWFKLGSRVIITTQDKQVLLAHGVKFIDVNLLSRAEAICLLSRSAFKRDIPIEGYEDQSGQVVKYADGLPLTIKVLGSMLYGQNKPNWINTLERLKKIPLKATMEKLELSYIDLEEDHKEIFLDIACILKCWTKDDAVIALESCGFFAEAGLRVLEQKSLITISEGGFLGMHDHIEEMGKNIVRRVNPNKPEMHSRLWIKEEIVDILANDLGTQATQCITLDLVGDLYREGLADAEEFDGKILMNSLANMKELRFLEVYAENCSWNFDDDSLHLPNALRFLKWDDYPFSSLPETFQAKNLVGLEMRWSNMVQLWKDGEEKPFLKLRFLKFVCSGLRTLDLSAAPNLETLILVSCDLEEINAPAECLKKLLYLHFSHCGWIKSFVFDKELDSSEDVSLSELHLSADVTGICDPGNTWPVLQFSCYYTEDPASCFGNLERLISLGSGARINIDSISDIICGLQYLRKLTLKGSIPEVPKDIYQLECLEELRLISTDIKNLPDSICMLKHLKSLEIKSCYLLEKLPEDIGRLECLERLILMGCILLQDIPDSICEMKRLEYLRLPYCILLEKLPEELGHLECLKELDIEGTGICLIPQSIFRLKGHLQIVGDRWLLEPCGLTPNRRRMSDEDSDFDDEMVCDI